jgi:ABC-type dipeptide/oligopeptide/nickel transport system permease subunit
MRLYRINTQIKIITRHRFGTFGAVVLLFFALVGLLAPYIAPHDPWESLRGADGKLAMLKPPSWEFPLGTTMMGRDILSQMIQATRTTVIIGLISGLMSILIGANIGLLSAYYGGKLDEIMMRFTDGPGPFHPAASVCSGGQGQGMQRRPHHLWSHHAECLAPAASLHRI